MGSRRKGRIIAVQSLYSWQANEPGRDHLLDFEWLDRDDVPDDTLAFARMLTSGVVEHVEEVDALIERHLDHWDITRLSRVDLAILRMACYSLLHQKDIPASVTIDEAIAISKDFGTDDSYRFVNGVLDSIRRDIG